VVATSGGDGGSSAKGKGVGDPLDELFPRVDLEKLIGATSIVADAKNEAWKTRKEALESLQGILDVGTNKRLKGNLGMYRSLLNNNLFFDCVHRV
jgi:cytoskeleton-associated protein 5